MNNDSSWGGIRGGHWYCYLLFTAAEQRLTLQIIYATKHSGKTPHSNKNYECSRGINCCAWCTPGYAWPFGCQGKLLAHIQLAINQNSHVLPVGLLSSLSSPNLYVQAGFPQPWWGTQHLLLLNLILLVTAQPSGLSRSDLSSLLPLQCHPPTYLPGQWVQHPYTSLSRP